MRSTGSEPSHEPVLLSETVSALAPRPDGVYVDGTVGLGGHTAALLAAGAGRVIGIDRDVDAIAATRARLEPAGDRVTLAHGDYRDLAALLAGLGVTTVDGVLVDMGVSSMQLGTPERGFSFRHEGPLDMRLDRSRGATLAERLAAADEAELAEVIATFGEERRARRVARAVMQARDRGALTSTTALASVVRRAAGGGEWQRIDPATRSFQAFRIWVNGELDGLETFLAGTLALVKTGGRVAIIAFHSLEDRVVKHTMRALAADGRAALVTRRPIVPAPDEVARNPRARSARLRVMERVA